MRWAGYLDPAEVRKTIETIQAPGTVFECRILGTSKKDVISGYFQDVDTMLKQIESVNPRARNVYMTLSLFKKGLDARSQMNHFLSGANTTSDTDIASYRWLFIDLDPVRPTGISSSQEEFEQAKKLAKKVYLYLQGLGFEEPVKALSGNGCHLLYRIALDNTKENTALVEKCLKTLAVIFDSPEVKVDTTNYNPSRICKLHGTLAQKGTSTTERPHRMSKIFHVPDEIKITSKVFLQKLVEELPDAPAPDRYQRRQASPAAQSDFDVRQFMADHGMTYEEDSNDRATIFRLDECPFDHSHQNGDAKIFLYHNGAVAFKCHHNSCRDYRWQDVRLKFDPTAYDSSYDGVDPVTADRIDKGWQQHNRDKAEAEIAYEERQDDAEMFRTAKQIYEDPEPDYEYIRSGITEIDRLCRGLQKTGLSVISGTRASGKSTLIGQIVTSALNDGHTAVVYSGELNNKKYLRWLMRIAAGKNHVRMTPKGVVVPQDVERKIIEWMGDRFWLYDNKYGNQFQRIEQKLRIVLKERKADICIIDNLMALDLSTYNRDKYDAQTQFVWALKNLAELTNTHIIFVAHPKKASGFLRLDDISGSGNISNIVDNAFVVHRCNRDFVNGISETFKQKPEKMGVPEKATNVIEIAKDRENGTQDVFVPLYFEDETKRLRNSLDEYVQYGWMVKAEDEFMEVAEDDDEIPF